MKLSPRERRLLLLLVPAMLLVWFLWSGIPKDQGNATNSASNAQPDANGIELAQQRVTRLRQLKSLIPAREAVLKQTTSDLSARERGLIPGDTAAQAQAALLEAARRVGKTNQLDVRGSDFPPPTTLGDYGIVYTNITFECHIEQLVNFLADLGRQPELMIPSDEHIAAGADRKQKIVLVKITLAGAVPKKLIPEKKGLAAF